MTRRIARPPHGRNAQHRALQPVRRDDFNISSTRRFPNLVGRVRGRDDVCRLFGDGGGTLGAEIFGENPQRVLGGIHVDGEHSAKHDVDAGEHVHAVLVKYTLHVRQRALFQDVVPFEKGRVHGLKHFQRCREHSFLLALVVSDFQKRQTRESKLPA